MRRAIEEDRLVLHELRGVNLKVDFFLGTRKEFIDQTKCIRYSVCYEYVDVRVDQITYTEPLYGLDFYYSVQQIFIDDHILSGEVVSFYCEQANDDVLTTSCKILLGRDY